MASPKMTKPLNLDDLRDSASPKDEDDDDYRPRLGFSFVNRGYAEYRPFVSTEVKKEESVPTYNPISAISQVPVKQQRYIRNALNASRASDQQIGYEHIKPGSPDFNKKYVKMILNYFNAKEYLHFTQQHKQPLLDDDNVMSSKESIQQQFVSIPKRTREKLMISLGLRPENISHYSLNNKKQIIAMYGVQKAEKRLDRDFNKIPLGIKKEIMSDLSLNHAPHSHLTREHKRQILDIFGSEYVV